MEKEMNFWDLCVTCFRAIGRACVWTGDLLTRMVRLSWRYWWLVILFIVMAGVASLYYTRYENMKYRVNAVTLLNGPSIQQFDQAFSALQANQLIPTNAAIKPFLDNRIITHLTTYRVIDCLDDNTPDYIDFKRKIAPTDTTEVQMQDRLCIQFRIKQKNLDAMPEIESAILSFLNASEPMKQSFAAYQQNLRDEVAFNHSQALKLDSLTSHYYFYSPSGMEPNAYVGTGVNFYGDRRIRLFLDEIYEQHERLQKDDYRLQLTTDPVVLENHFSVDPKPINGRLKCLVIFLLLGWIAGCAFAAIMDNRKAIYAWLKQ